VADNNQRFHMKYINLFATTAMSVALAAGAASAQDLGSNSFSAGVSLLSPEMTGFMYGGTTEVTGLGSAAVVVAAEAAQFSMSGFADSTVADNVSGVPEANANSGSISTFQFDRTVTASASGVGKGRVLANGEASASVGAVGSSFADTMSNNIETTPGALETAYSADGGDTFEDVSTLSPADIQLALDNNVFVAYLLPTAGTSVSSTSDAVSTSAASLVGNGTTSVIAGLIGTSDEFIGSTGTTVSSTQSGVAFSGLNVSGTMTGTGMSIGAAADSDLSAQLAALTAGTGIIGFTNDFTLGGGTIDLGVTNLGGGTVSLGASTGGFFGGGADTFGESGFGKISATIAQ
jgi:hypothetical protein